MAKRSTTFRLFADAARFIAVKRLLVSLCLLQIQGGWAQETVLSGRIDRNRGGDQTIGSTFYVLQGQSIVFNCFCSGYDTVEMLRNTEQVQPTRPCPTRLIYSINSTATADGGQYVCRATHANGSVVDKLLGNMTIVAPSLVEVEPNQYGFFNTPTVLNCTTQLQHLDITTKWFKKEGSMDVNLNEAPSFKSTAISDEGEYICEVFITNMNIKINKTINFHVIALPRIFLEAQELEFYGNNRQEITVPFQSRFMYNTFVTWWKDDILLTQDSNIREGDISPPNHTTTLVFNPTRRNDSGNYKVSVENRFDAIPRHLQVAQVCLTVRIIVAPAKPVVTASEPFNTISWSLPAGISEDERANSFTVSLNFTNGTVAQELTFTGEVSGQAELSVVPGMTYAVAIIAHNLDGSTVSDVQDFTTPPGAPSVPYVTINRLSNTSIELIVNLAYTGGGNITVLDVSFREIGTKEWVVIGLRDANSMSEMTWKTRIIDDRFIGIGVEFQVAVRNIHGHKSDPVVLLEPLVLPGAPSLQEISMSYDSLMIQLTFSNEGTPPILSLVVEFTAPEHFTRNFTGPFIPGEVYNLRVAGLQDSTQYSFTLSAVNYQGRGMATGKYNSTTTKRPPLGLHEIIIIAIAAAALVAIAVLTLTAIFLVKSRRHKQKKTYFFNNQGNMDVNSEEKQLDSSHEMIRRGSNSYTQHNPTLPSSRSILSTSTTNSSYLPTSPTFSPSGAPPILRISDPSSVERYRYETCSSTASSSGQSDDSDPAVRYTYNISPSPPAVEVDTPELRAESTYSVMTTTTHMTSSSESTRESLHYPHESNATVV